MSASVAGFAAGGGWQRRKDLEVRRDGSTDPGASFKSIVASPARTWRERATSEHATGAVRHTR